MPLALYLSLKELWRQRGRFLLFSLVIALITVLVLFITALGAGLAKANREYLGKLDADLLLYQENSDLLISASRLAESKIKEVRRLDGVADAGLLGFSNATILTASSQDSLDVTLIGAQVGKPGEPPLLSGATFRNRRASEAIIDAKIASLLGLQPGDAFVLKSVQGADDEFYELNVAGITDERQFLFQNSIVVPFDTWEKVRPKASENGAGSELIGNVIAVKLVDPEARNSMQLLLQERLDGVEVADKETAIRSIPGYSVQQQVLNTQKVFTLLIGLLVVGGFFQIQTLQKVAQIGMLKAIGATNRTVASAALAQIILVTLLGVAIGGFATLLLVLGLPAQVPVLFSGSAVVASLVLLLIIGPFGGMVSVRAGVRVEPLRAIGL